MGGFKTYLRRCAAVGVGEIMNSYDLRFSICGSVSFHTEKKVQMNIDEL